ncbi:hypothetical protein [uncultured Tissierella sp.]|uniref:hypothetical protein n=1 Tax=uncultured Tissierella sp. TaxID=448160 RepID=UPI0035A67270
MRHGFCIRGFRNDEFNIRGMQELLGHSSVSTMQVYTSVVLEDLSEELKNRKSIMK